MAPPIKYPTPYGGRLEWTCPGGNKIVAHLKDKVKIRHKKRWSQVNYLDYFDENNDFRSRKHQSLTIFFFQR